MRLSAFIASAVAAVVVTAGLALPVGSASALPLAGVALEAVQPQVHRVAHKPKEWHWDGGWWKHGPWADHRIQGMVFTRPWPSAVFVPWGIERLRYCAATYRSFDPATGTYLAVSGERRVCR